MKKPSIVSFLITFLLAAAVSIQGQESVTDSDGFAVRTGQQYFIQPVKTSSNNGGGLVPATNSLLPRCPLTIAQTILPGQPGLQVSFALTGSTEETLVETSIPVTIEFKSEVWPFCKEYSKVWAAEDSSSDTKEPAVFIGGTPGSQNTLFRIEKAEGANTYRLTSSTGTVGTTPGIWFDAPRLVLTNDYTKTLLVKFKRYEDASMAAASTSPFQKLRSRMFLFY